jgi:hypothetical protein
VPRSKFEVLAVTVYRAQFSNRSQFLESCFVLAGEMQIRQPFGFARVLKST